MRRGQFQPAPKNPPEDTAEPIIQDGDALTKACLRKLRKYWIGREREAGAEERVRNSRRSIMVRGGRGGGGGAPWRKRQSLQPVETLQQRRLSCITHARREEKCVEEELAERNPYGLIATPVPLPLHCLGEEEVEESGLKG
ncbi:hypothetical protein llap_5479 [Limosa lapponica baueri]|uniref:Uncharacterized protein n=1 Tax=Limosa lapponica baueri TaxID=1758121 RepID=A0A2I0UDW7_LIMLA|nr:hypothetical protein llap_5479 [Limosa lapponica baueri]